MALCRFTVAVALTLAACVHTAPDAARLPGAAPAQHQGTEARPSPSSSYAAGDPDQSFGEGGLVVTDFAPRFSEGVATRVAVQPDGRIVLAGRVAALAALVRYLPDGRVDESFGEQGVATLALKSERDGPSYSFLDVRADGRILAGGTTDDGRVFLARHLPDGKLDTSFGRGGLLVARSASAFGRGAVAAGGERVTLGALTFAVQPDDKVVAAGVGAGGRLVLARFLPTGALDTSFGRRGAASLLVAEGVAVARKLLLLSDGRIIVAGEVVGRGNAARRSAVASPEPRRLFLARFNSGGQTDTGFGRGGVVEDRSDAVPGSVGALAADAEGRIVVAGAGGFSNALRRYLPDGRPDTNPGGGSAPPAPPERGVEFEGFNALALHGDGRVVAAGTARRGSEFYFVVARYLPEGALDAGFGRGGAAWTKVGSGSEGARGLALQADGRIVAAGSSRFRFAAARYLP